MEQDSTTTNGIGLPVRKESAGKKMNFIPMMSRINVTIKDGQESSFRNAQNLDI